MGETVRRTKGRARTGTRAKVAGTRAKAAAAKVEQESVEELQRVRLVAAMLDVAAERGAANVTVAQALRRSGVSRRSFYELFSDRDDCLLAAQEHALALASQCVVPAYQAARGWRAQIRAALTALLAFFEQYPALARMLVAELPTRVPGTPDPRGEALAQVIAAVEEGRKAARSKSKPPPPLIAEALVGGVEAVIRARVDAGSGEGLSALANDLMSMIVLPYLGPAAAREELERRPDEGVAAAAFQQGVGDAFHGPKMRFTYRTMRVLAAVGEHRGASNGAIAQAAGIADPGYTSKLLARLRSLGLIENETLRPRRGVTNAWALTDDGAQLVRSVDVYIARPADRS